MEPRGGGSGFQCVCKQTVKPFLKILDLADIGLKIYRYFATKYAQAAGVLPETGAGTDVFILQNTRDQDLQSSSFIEGLDVDKINCPKCRQVAKHAKRLIETIPSVNKGNVVGVCDHCRKRAEPRCSCGVCDKIVKKFVTSGDKRKQDSAFSEPNIILRSIKSSPEKAKFLSKPQWDDSFLDIRKHFEQKFIPCLSKPQHETAARDEIRKYFREASLIRSRSETCIAGLSELTEKILDKTFEYYFPSGERKLLSEKEVIDTEEKSRLLAEAREPQASFHKYEQPIPAGRIHKVNYDAYGQPIERIQEVYYDKYGQPIPPERMQEVYYDKNGKPIPGRWVPEVHYDKYGRPLQRGKVPNVYYDKHGQSIGSKVPEPYYDEQGQLVHGADPYTGRQVPEAYYDERGQPVQRPGEPTGGHLPQVYYDERGQPVHIPGPSTDRHVPQVYYDEQGQPIQRPGAPTGRHVPEVYYDERGQPIQRPGAPTGRHVPEVYYDERGQPIQRPGAPTGRHVPEVYYDERGQPIKRPGAPTGRHVPEVYYDERGQPIQRPGAPTGRHVPEVYYDERGQPIQRPGAPTGRHVPEVYYDERGQPIQRPGAPTGRHVPEVYYDERGQPIQRPGAPTGRHVPEPYYGERGQRVLRPSPPAGTQGPEVYYDERRQPVQKPGPPTGKQVPEAYYDDRGKPSRRPGPPPGKLVPEAYYDDRGQPIRRLAPSTGKQVPEAYYDDREQPIRRPGKPTRTQVPKVYDDERRQPIQVAKSEGTSKKGYKSSTIPSLSTDGFESDTKSKTTTIKRDKKSPTKLGSEKKNGVNVRGPIMLDSKKEQDLNVRGTQISDSEKKKDSIKGSTKLDSVKEKDSKVRDLTKLDSKKEKDSKLGDSTKLDSKKEKDSNIRGTQNSGSEKEKDSKGKSFAKSVSKKEKDSIKGSTKLDNVKEKDSKVRDSTKLDSKKEKDSKLRVSTKLDSKKEKDSNIRGTQKSDTEKEKDSKSRGSGKSDSKKEKGSTIRSSTKLDNMKEKDKESKIKEPEEKRVESISERQAREARRKEVEREREMKEQDRVSTKLDSGKEKDTKIRDSMKFDSKTEKDKEKRKKKLILSPKEIKEFEESKIKEPEEKRMESKSEREARMARRRERDHERGILKEPIDKSVAEKEEDKENIAQPKTTANKDDGLFQKKLQEAKKQREKEKVEKDKAEKENLKEEKADKDSAKKSEKAEKFLSKVLTRQDKAKLAEEKRKMKHDEQLRKIKESINKKVTTTSFKSAQPGDEILEMEKHRKLFQIDEDLISKSPRHHKEPKPTKEFNFRLLKLQQSRDDLISTMVKVKAKIPKRHKVTEKELELLSKIYRSHAHGGHSEDQCGICVHSDLQIQLDNFMYKKRLAHRANDEIIIGKKVKTFKDLSRANLLEYEEGSVDEALPVKFKTKFTIDSTAEVTEDIPKEPKPPTPPAKEQTKSKTSANDEEAKKGVIRYQLSDRSFIDKGWTMLPTEKVVRKMNVYRMRPAHPEFCWFERNKKKRYMQYDSGDKLAEFTDDGRGRWFYRNGKVALDYYSAEETHCRHRFVVFSSGELDDRGRTYPNAVLATFDYLGNGIVFDHNGKIRLKYNQTEGVVLDRSLGPVSHWKWHTLNDPPELQQVMIDTHLFYKDPDILEMGNDDDKQYQSDNEEMIAIEFVNFLKKKKQQLKQKFKPFQIKMKALKINDHFSLRILDQSSVYLIFRDGTTNLKLNIGMVLDDKEIVDTDTADMGDVANSIERLPARTNSLAGLQACINETKREARLRLKREQRLRPPVACASVDQLRAAASRPLRRPIHPAPSDISSETEKSSVYKKKSVNNLCHATSII